jgi:hypothetical protein
MEILKHLSINTKVYLDYAVEKTSWDHLASDDVYVVARKHFESEVLDFMQENSLHFKDLEVANLILKTSARVIEFATGRITHQDGSVMLLELDGTKEVLQKTKEAFLEDWQYATKGPWVNEPHITCV